MINWRMFLSRALLTCRSYRVCAFAISLLLSLSPPVLSAEAKPLKVYILVGQSNMQGHAHVRTMDHIGMDSETAPLLKGIRSQDGKPKVFQDVWISYLSAGGEKSGRLTTGFGADENKIGPELTFGMRMHQELDEPFLIIKTAWGGKSINTDFRPPSAGPYLFNEIQLEHLKKQGKDLDEIKAAKEKATGHYYRLMLDHVKKVLADIKKVYPAYNASQGYQIAGFVWFQGWNDMVDRGTYPNRDKPGGYGTYGEVMAQFIRDVRKDLSVPKLPFVIGVLGVGGPVEKYGPSQQRYRGIHQNFRDAMASPALLPEFDGNVGVVLTENFWDHQLTALKTRDGKVRQEVKNLQKEKNLNREEAREALEKQRAEAFTKQELEILEKGISNQEYHYLGSAKIMARIGQGFAEALLKMQKDQR